MGDSLAIIRATALADALQKYNGNFDLAFQDYNKELRPFIEEVQEVSSRYVRRFASKNRRRNSQKKHRGFYEFLGTS
jgi:2-polyprenyl-6-methoxyphenol hydroxylase-like FAD-dependent oxidoreductase